MRVSAGALTSGLDDGDDEPDRGEDVADPDTLGFGTDLHDGLAGVVHLPCDLPALRFAAGDGLLKLADDLLERVAIAVVQDRHPRWRDRVLDRVLDVGVRSDALGPH